VCRFARCVYTRVVCQKKACALWARPACAGGGCTPSRLEHLRSHGKIKIRSPVVCDWSSLRCLGRAVCVYAHPLLHRSIVVDGASCVCLVAARASFKITAALVTPLCASRVTAPSAAASRARLNAAVAVCAAGSSLRHSVVGRSTAGLLCASRVTAPPALAPPASSSAGAAARA
jgi:hypothetical protein